MRPKWTLLGATLVVLFAAAGQAAADKRALMVGINEYPFLEERHQLRGCENDVRTMSELLSTKFGFPKGNVKLLLSRAATRDAIIGAVGSWLIQPSKPGDLVLFYFSGHGSQIEDQNKDEPDGLDETLCPSDVGPNTADRQIPDDEIARWIKQLQEKGVRDIVLVVDACHSGTITKGLLSDTGMVRSRYLEPEVLLKRSLEPGLPPEGAGEGGAPAGRAGDQDTPDDVILISGCKANQLSNDAQLGGTYYGALSYFLHARLQSAPAGATYAEVMEKVRAQVQERFPTQTPQFEGPADRPVLTAAGPAKASFVLVTQASGGNVELAAGASSGVTLGSIYQVYRPGDNALSGPGIGRVEVTSVRRQTATARVLKGSGAITPQCRAVEVEHAFLPEKLLVSVTGEEGTPTAALATALKRIEYVAAPGQGQSLDRLVKLYRRDGALKAQVLTPDGMPGQEFTGDDADDLAGKLQPELENAFTIKLLARLENPNPSFKVKVRIDREDDPVYYFDRDEIRFRIQADRDCHITVLDVGTSGRITVLFPNAYHKDSLIKANQEYTIPPPEAGYQITVGRPVGREMVKVIATEKPVNLTGLNFQAMESDFAGLPDSLDFVKKLSQRLRDFVVVQRPQGQTAGAGTPTAGWATDFVTFQIRDPKDLQRP